MNEIELSSSLDQLELEINWHKENFGRSAWEIGRRLNHVKENDLAHGRFSGWLEKIGINHNTANRFMKVAKDIPNSDTYHNLGVNALYLIATLPEEQKQEELNKAELGNPSTVRELRDLKKRLAQAQSEKEQAQRSEQLAIEQLEREQNKEPKVITETIEKEVVPDDYEDLKRMNQSLKNEIEFANKKYLMLEASTRSAKELEQKIRSLEDREQTVTQRIEAIERLNDLEEEFEKFFDTKVAPVRFKPITEELYGTNATQRIRQLVETARHWVEEMEDVLPQRDIQYAEIIEED